jgi:PAS domain S-box-containing protein
MSERLAIGSELLRITLASIGDGVIITDPENRVLTLNEAAEALTGWTQEEAGGHPFAEVFRIVHETTRQPAQDPAEQALREARTVALANHSVLIARGGAETPIDDSAAPIRDDEGRIHGAVVVFRSIAERKRAEETRSRLAAIVESSQDAIVSKTLEGRVHSWNAGAEELFGYREAEMIGEPIARLIPPEGQDEERMILERVRQGERVEHYETVRVAKDGRRIEVSLTVSPIRDGAGRIVGASKIARDVTVRKRVEAALRRREQTARFLSDASAALVRLTDPEIALRQLASLAVPGFADWCALDLVGSDGETRRVAVAHVDPRKVELVHQLGHRYPTRPPEERGVRPVAWTGGAEWEPLVREEALVERARDEEHLRIVRALGLESYLWVPVRSRDRVLGALTFVTAGSGAYQPGDVKAAEDLASRAAIAMENAALLDRLRDADRRKDEFLAILGHELRNPLAAVRTATHLLRAKGSGPGAERIAEVIDRQVRQMTRLVDDLLDVSRITRGELELRPERVELGAVVRAGVEASRAALEQGGQELTVTLPLEPVLLEADPARLAQVVSNVVTNAAKYTDRGGHIRVSAERQERDVVLRIRDDGMGIPAEALPRIFDLFTQVSGAQERSQGGLGLGLALVRRLVELHGGTIEARSDGRGKGSEFVVRLPCAGGSAAQPRS